MFRIAYCMMVLAVSAPSIACGGSEAPSAPTAVVQIVSVDASVNIEPSGLSRYSAFVRVESSGSATRVTRIVFEYATGQTTLVSSSWDVTSQPFTIVPNFPATLGPFRDTDSDSTHPLAQSVRVTVTYVDSAGRSSTASTTSVVAKA